MIPWERVCRPVSKQVGVICCHFPIASSITLLNLRDASVTAQNFSEMGVGGVRLISGEWKKRPALAGAGEEGM